MVRRVTFALLAVGLGLLLVSLLGGDKGLQPQSALARDGGDQAAETTNKQSALSLPSGEPDSAQVPRAVVSFLDTPGLVPSLDQEVADAVEPVLSASIQGQVSFPREHVPSRISFAVLGIKPGSGNLRIYKELSVSPDSGVQDGVHMTFAWKIQDLLPGEYRITYSGASIQGVTLEPGVNEVFAVLGEPQAMRVQVVDAQSGEPVLGAQISWANHVDDHPVGTRPTGLKQQSLYSTKGTCSISGIKTERIFIRVTALGYASLNTVLFLADGEKQTVTLDKICELVIEKLSLAGDQGMTIEELVLGIQLSLSAGGQLYSPVSAGWR
ncbi:MAG: hypothetical protein ACI9C2_000927, partial [Gammaproteobacteria bacterium]